jgi:sigma-B regulation protein RsbU (phosphoserine phosphatase)
VKEFQLPEDSAVAHVMEMLRRLSRVRSSAESFNAFMERFGRIRPVAHFVGVAPVRGEPGAFRVVYNVSIDDMLAGAASPHRLAEPGEEADLPVHRGGVIAELTRGAMPRLFTDLSLDDPLLLELIGAERAGQMRAVMAVPVVDGDDQVEWSIALSRWNGPYSSFIIEQATLTSNIMTNSQRYLNSLAEIRRLNRALDAQFRAVAEVQLALLPASIPSVPGLQIATSYLTSDQAGGDYYDFFDMGSGRWGVLVADVSGHGAAAATIMSMLHGILHSHLGEDRSRATPASVLAYANRRLCAAGIDGNFVTAFLAFFDPASARVVYSNAGHNPPRHKHGPTGRVLEVADAATLPLGIDPDAEFTVAGRALEPQDTLVMYTDGITEQFNHRQEMFGPRRLDTALHHCSGAPDCVVDSVHTALFEHTRARVRSDDQTLVAVRYTGPGGPGAGG